MDVKCWLWTELPGPSERSILGANSCVVGLTCPFLSLAEAADTG